MLLCRRGGGAGVPLSLALAGPPPERADLVGGSGGRSLPGAAQWPRPGAAGRLFWGPVGGQCGLCGGRRPHHPPAHRPFARLSTGGGPVAKHRLGADDFLPLGRGRFHPPGNQFAGLAGGGERSNSGGCGTTSAPSATGGRTASPTRPSSSLEGGRVAPSWSGWRAAGRAIRASFTSPTRGGSFSSAGAEGSRPIPSAAAKRSTGRRWPSLTTRGFPTGSFFPKPPPARGRAGRMPFSSTRWPWTRRSR